MEEEERKKKEKEGGWGGVACLFSEPGKEKELFSLFLFFNLISHL